MKCAELSWAAWWAIGGLVDHFDIMSVSRCPVHAKVPFGALLATKTFGPEGRDVASSRTPVSGQEGVMPREKVACSFTHGKEGQRTPLGLPGKEEVGGESSRVCLAGRGDRRSGGGTRPLDTLSSCRAPSPCSEEPGSVSVLLLARTKRVPPLFFFFYASWFLYAGGSVGHQTPKRGRAVEEEGCVCSLLCLRLC